MPSATNEDRREQPRVLINLRTPCALVSKGVQAEPITVIVRELSPTGIGWMCTTKMRSGQPFVITLKAGDEGKVSLHGDVLHCQTGGSRGNFYRIGAVITRVEPPVAAG